MVAEDDFFGNVVNSMTERSSGEVAFAVSGFAPCIACARVPEDEGDGDGLDGVDGCDVAGDRDAAVAVVGGSLGVMPEEEDVLVGELREAGGVGDRWGLGGGVSFKEGKISESHCLIDAIVVSP